MTVHDWFGEWNSPGWIAVYVVVALLVLGALALVGRRKMRDLDRQHAQALRTVAQRDEPHLARREAETKRLEAEAGEARAEADRRAAIAAQQRARLDREQRAHADRLREADRIDPDADHPAGSGARHRGDG